MVRAGLTEQPEAPSRQLSCHPKAGTATYFQLLGPLPQRVPVDLQLLRSLGARLPGQDVLQFHVQLLFLLGRESGS